jgi:hypothetical protein
MISLQKFPSDQWLRFMQLDLLMMSTIYGSAISKIGLSALESLMRHIGKNCGRAQRRERLPRSQAETD